MAGGQEPGSGGELQPEEFVHELAPDPRKVPDVVALRGYVGEGPDGYWRLYFTPDLTDYVEVEKSKILHHVSLASAERPLGGTVIWVDADTALRYVSNETAEVEAEYFRGTITRALQAYEQAISGGEGGTAHPPYYVTTCNAPSSRPCFPCRSW